MAPIFNRPRRNFDPDKSARYGIPTFSTEKLVKYSPKYQYSRLFNFPFSGSHWRPRMNTVVVKVQGIAIPNNKGDPNSKAAFGVSFGPDSPLKISAPLHPSLNPTNNRAVLAAVNAALGVVRGMKLTGEWDDRWKEIIVMLNSEHVARALDEWVWDWAAENWEHRSGGRKIANVEAMRQLHNLISSMERELNLSIRFWKVKREDIDDADQLAKQAMN